jgi:outer membrane protein OmpA-like peptidoglycan-associated protein
MKKLILSLLALGIGTAVQAQILDSLRMGAQSVQYEIIAPSNYEDFSATPYGEQLLFVSSRETGLFSKKYDYNNQKFFDLYLYDFKSKEVSRYGDQLASLESSKYHLGPSILLPDSAGIVLSRNYKLPNLEDEVNFYLVYENWQTGERYTMPYCTMANSFQHPFYDAKTRRLFFSANLPGGPGGYDIYYSEFLKDGTWGDPIIVQGVNGPRDDVFPTISKDGKLYFSRTETQMGLDVFVFDMETQLLQACKAPFITSRDEFSLVALNKDSAVFSQSQSGRFNTDLVLAWIDSKETALTPITQEYLVYIEVEENEDPWTLAHILTDKYPDQNIYVGEKDGEMVIVAKGSSPEMEALSAQEALRDSNYVALVTTEPIKEVGRPVDPELEGSDDRMAAARLKEETLLHVVYPIEGNIAEAQVKLDQIRSSSGMANLTLGEVNGELVLIVSTNGTRNDAEKMKALAQERGLASSYLTPVTPKKVAYTKEEPSDATSYSTIAGVFVSLERAQNQLKRVQNWSPNAFISKINEKYYVVSSDYEGEKSAIAAQNVARENGVDAAWLLPQKLEPMNLPSLSGSPDLIVYFRFDKYDIQEKYANQIDDVVAQLSENVENVFMVGHTDSRGTNAYNEVLSRQRVEEVSAYLESKHSSLKVLETLDSRGEHELTNDCGDGMECDPYAHFLNRRVEIWFY